MKENEKGAFLSKVEDFAKEMSEMASEREGVRRGLIVLAVDDVKDDGNLEIIVSASGNRIKLAELVARFVMGDDTKPLVSLGLKLVAMKTLIEKIEGESNN